MNLFRFMFKRTLALNIQHQRPMARRLAPPKSASESLGKQPGAKESLQWLGRSVDIHEFRAKRLTLFVFICFRLTHQAEAWENLVPG